MALRAEDLEDLDNLDPDDFDDEMDTAENRGDVADPNEDEGEEEITSETEEETTDETEEDSEEDSEEETTDETEEETTDETEEETTDETEAATEEVVDDPRIPKSRFDSVNARRKEAERRLAELESQMNQTGEQGQRADRVTEIRNELGELDDKINDAILDADAAKLKELRAKERELNNEALQFQLRNATAQAAEEAKYEALLDKVEADYPEYNPDSETYNEEMVSETLRLQKALISNGSSKNDALTEAIDLIRPRYVTNEALAGTKPSLRDKPAAPKRETKTNTKRNKKTAKAQPANTASRTSKLESDEDIDFDNIQQPEDIDKFDEKTLARLSGDFVD